MKNSYVVNSPISTYLSFLKDIRSSFKVKELYIGALRDDCTRLTYTELLKDKKASTLTYLMARFLSWFKRIYNFEFETITSDGGTEFKNPLEREHPFEALYSELGIRHICTRPYRSQTNGKIEGLWRIIKKRVLLS
jgi:IS30 family transposase